MAGRYALVVKKSKLVENVIMYEEGSNYIVPDGYELVPAENVGSPGDTWDGKDFIPPAPKSEPKLKTPEEYKIEYNELTTTIDRKIEIQAILLSLRDPEPV